jgi:hypothetical protein
VKRNDLSEFLDPENISMPRYEHPDLSFHVADGWHDRTITAFSAPEKPGQKIAPNVVVTRDPVTEGEPLTAYADRQVIELAKRLDHFHLLRRQERLHNGSPVVDFAFTWKASAGTFQQRQVCALVRGKTLVTVTCTALKDDYAQAEPGFNALLDSLRIGNAPEKADAPHVAARRY